MSITKTISHAIIQFNTVAGSKETGVHAGMKLCFGSDEDAISQIMYRTEPGNTSPSWVLPYRRGRENETGYSIFDGKVGEELLAVVGRTADRFKKAEVKGKLAGRTFRVTKTGVEEIVIPFGNSQPSATNP